MPKADAICVSNDRGWPESQIPKQLRKHLTKGNVCYVLITCSHPSEAGKMEVQMTYEGDPNLAEMIIETAQVYIQEDQENVAD